MTFRGWSAALLALTACVTDYSPDFEDAKRYAADAGRDASQRDASARDAATVPDANAADASEVVVDGAQVVATPCSLAGRWLVTERVMTNGLGAKQVSHSWYLLQIAQQDAALTVDKSLACGTATKGLAPITVVADMSKSFSSFLTRVKMDGRTGSAQPSANGCDVELAQSVVVYGASTPHYLDLANPLPSADQAASGDTPGWEDWDGDGNPGISIRMTGSVSGTMYTVTRTRARYFGSIADGATAFDLAIDGNSENSTLGIDGSPLLDIEGVRDPDDTQHYVGFARLADDQAAAADDAANCAELRALAPTLTAHAME